MEEKKKNIIIIIIAVCVVIIECVYMSPKVVRTIKDGSTQIALARDKESLEERRKSEALAYLEERYGEEFVIDYYRAPGYAYDYVQMYAYPKGKEDEEHKFEIQGRRNKKKKEMEYTDTYVMVKLTEEYKTCVDEIVDEYFDDFKVFLEFRSEWITSNLPPDTKVEDLFELRANVDYPLPSLDIFLKSSQRKDFSVEQVKKLGKALAMWGFRGPIYITCYDTDEYFENKNIDNHKECMEGEHKHWEYHYMFIRDKNTFDFR